jgi:hypothetical protein
MSFPKSNDDDGGIRTRNEDLQDHAQTLMEITGH